ncbi:MAG TPA: acyclic terpene utilization AtuA family protein [Longimicrobiales bacterium]|nr:acyclic terpene utilization AtuA family protein [Longimicrobiales bacterium]
MTPPDVVRIGGGQGFWGDDLDAPGRLVREGPLDYLVLDYLAEVTMSILRKLRDRDPTAGYARDFVTLMEDIFPVCVERGIRVVANAGGVNPRGCAEALVAAAERAGVSGRVRLGLVTGDDLVERLDDLADAGHALAHLETGAPLATIRDHVRSANAYLGSAPVASALARGADIVVTGRVADPSLTVAALIHRYGWDPADADLMAAAALAGHVIECGAQATGGNCMAEWWTIPALDRIGFPVVEVEPSGAMTVTKHPGTGGRVDRASVTEQIVYEIGDPREVITPDVRADFTTIRLRDEGGDRVRLEGIRGAPATDCYKVSVSYTAGWTASGTLLYTWPDPVQKARAADAMLRRRFERLGLRLDAVHTELVGWNAGHGPLSGPPPENATEVQLRMAVRSRHRPSVERFAREMAPLVLTGPPSVTGYAGGRARVQEVVAYWPALVRKDAVDPHVRVEVLEG